jgi:hypothetical protein
MDPEAGRRVVRAFLNFKWNVEVNDIERLS